MFETLKKGGRDKQAAEMRAQGEELRGLISKAREERGALSTMLTQVELRGGKISLPQVGKAVQRATEKITATTTKLDEMTSQLAALEGRTRGLEEIGSRVRGLTESVGQAEQTARTLLAPDGELQQHRNAVQQLSSQALQTSGSLEALKKDQAALEDFRAQVRQSEIELKGSVDRAEGLKAELDQLRGTSAALQQESTKLKEAVRLAREDATSTGATVKEIEKKLGSFAELNELSKTTEERISALNVLAEHVSQKIKMLENQKHTVEHAVVESNRLNEMAWSMDVQIAKLQDGGRQAARTEETVERIERLARDATAQLEAAVAAKDALSLDVAKLERDRGQLSEFIRGYLERLTVEKKEIEAFDQRLQVQQAAIAGIERSVESVAAKEQQAVAIGHKLGDLEKHAITLATQTDELQQKQVELDGLQERLGQVEELAKTTASQHETLLRSREDLDELRKEIEAFYASHTKAAQLRDKLGADRAALEGFLGRMNEFSGQLPDLDARMNAITAKLSVVDEGTQKATTLVSIAADLDQQMTRIAGQQQHVERVDGRLRVLHDLSGDIDRKLELQLGRREEVESLRSVCDGLSIQVADVQQRLDGVSALQHKLLPITTQLAVVKNQLEKTQTQVEDVRKSDKEVIDQERRLTALLAGTRSVAAEADERLAQVQGLIAELARSVAVKEELSDELGRVQYRQREVGAHFQTSEDQLKRVEAMTKQLERRRSRLAFGEKKIATFESRLGELKTLADEVDAKIQAIAVRDTFVESVKQEVEGLHEISARSKADLDHVAAHRADAVTSRERANEVLACVGETEQRMAVIESRRKLVDEVQRKTNVIVTVLEDVRVNLETLSEQKAVIDHVVDSLGSLNSTVQAAQATLKALQAERELAERIQSGIKQLRARTGGAVEGQRSA